MTQQYSVVLPPDHRTSLEQILRHGTLPAAVHTRAQILLLADRSQGQHRSDAAIAARVQVCPRTVRRLRQRYLAGGLPASLYDHPRPGQPPKITGAVEARLTVLACSTPPDGQARWTLRLLADRLVELGYVDRISHTAVGNRLKKTR